MFENGKILEAKKYDPEFSARAIAVERAKFFFLYYIEKNKLSGQVIIEAQNEKLNFICDVTPKKHLKPLKTLLHKKYSIVEPI